MILIDTGYINTLHLVINSIYKLGFNPENIKYIINTHWHCDHTEGTKALAYLTGAKTLLGKDDAVNAAKYFTPNILICDGDKTVYFLSTPGHTKGTISLFFNTSEKGKTYRVGMFGGAGANTLVKGKYYFDGCVKAYKKSLKRLKKEKVDVFIGNHVWNNNTEEFGKILLKTGENKFIDSNLWERFLSFCEERLNQITLNDDYLIFLKLN